MKITIITDDLKSWFIPYGNELMILLSEKGHDVTYVHNKNDIERGDICFILSCISIMNEGYLAMNKNNIVVHASDLPRGKGFSPMQWQVLEGRDEIVLTLFEARKEFDAGPFYFKKVLKLNGTELYIEMREKLGTIMIAMCTSFIEDIDKLNPTEQTGNETFYHRRTTKDDELDIKKSIEEQFNHFRIADNDNHPLHFKYKNRNYILKIYSTDN
ncbi:MAG: methionyl-tRNA formyltransferase [Ignavibacteria bacterium]